MSTLPVTPKPPDAMIVKLAAFFIERSAKNYVATISFCLLALATSLPVWTSIVPAKYQAQYAAAVAFLVALGGALAKFKD